jgi:hypothetical protein
VPVRADRLQLAAVEGPGAVGAAEALAVALDSVVAEDGVTMVAAQDERHHG